METERREGEDTQRLSKERKKRIQRSGDQERDGVGERKKIKGNMTFYFRWVRRPPGRWGRF